jgi:hypothetical protein
MYQGAWQESERLKDHTDKSKLDMVAITETCFNNDFDLKEACLKGFKAVHQPREGRRGGVVDINYIDNINLNRHSLINNKSFQTLDVSFAIGSRKDIRLLDIYGPPGNSKAEFLEEFQHLLRASRGGKVE